MPEDDREILTSRLHGRWRISLREIVLAALLLLALFLFFLFAGLYGQSSIDLKAAKSKSSSVKPQCSGLWCLETSAHVELFLNRSVDPCDNFYQFACGGYKVVRKLDPGRDSYVNVLQELYQNNQAVLRNILVSGKLPKDLNSSSSERKLKDFYGSCLDDFSRERLKGKPLIAKVFPLMGGSYLTDPSWNATSWDFNGTLAKTQTDLFVKALFSAEVEVDPHNSSQRIIAIHPGGTGKFLQWEDYIRVHPLAKKLQRDYKTFIRTVARLVTRDAGVKDGRLTQRIEMFVNDTYTVESLIAQAASDSSNGPQAPEFSLRELTQTTGNVINWTEQMSYLFNEAGVTGSMKVAVPNLIYLQTLCVTLNSSFAGNLPIVNRMLHNYLTWRVLEQYVQDLSWEYVHANRQLSVDKYGYQNFLGTKKYCFLQAQRYFDIALGVLYIRTSFDKQNKNKVTEITETVKTALETLINKNSWMDQATKAYAISKMKNSTYKIGYPDFMDQPSAVDAIYAKLSINASDLFGNLLNLNQQHRRELNRELREGEDRSEWIFNTFDTNMAVYWSWDEVIVPAGILQFPMYTHDMPHYYTFGAIGSVLGQFIHFLIDESGRHWDKGGDLIMKENGWWSNQTLENYNKTRQCVVNVYDNITEGPFVVNGETKYINVSGEQYAGEAIAITTGLRLAYNAYQSWQRKYGRDPYPPGLAYTPQQLFFIAHAQVFCSNRVPDFDYYYTLYRKKRTDETRVNIPLKELPEFKEAYGCQTADNMVSAKPCTYY